MIESNTTPEMVATTKVDEFSLLLITMFKGVLYRENDSLLWNALLKLQARVRDYVTVLGLDLMLDEAEGYAFLRARVYENDDRSAQMPRLIARRQLSFPISLLLALLRKRMAEFDARGGDTRLILSRSQIVDLVKIFLPDSNNETRLIGQVETNINKIIELGFLRKLKVQSSEEDSFEVKRIIKAFVDAQWLSDFDTRLAEYQARISGIESEDGND